MVLVQVQVTAPLHIMVDWTGHDFLTNSTGNGNCVFLCTNYVNGGTNSN